MHPRKLFGLGGIRGVVGEYPITPDDVMKFGIAVTLYANDIGVKNVFIARDTRASGEKLSAALAAGLCSQGIVVQDLGVLPTHALAFFTEQCEEPSFGLMITASHNHYLENGIKIFGPLGRLFTEHKELLLEKIFFTMQNSQITIAGTGSYMKNSDARADYLDFLLSTIDYRRFPGYSVLIDCANGSASPLVKDLFAALGVSVFLINNSPNGENINLDCGAVHPEMAAGAVLQSGARLGVVLDGDADRIVLIDETGRVIPGDCLIAFLALELAEGKVLNKNRIVVTEYSNLALDEFLATHKLGVTRVQNGERNVVSEMDANSYALGGEYTGHIIFGEYSSAGDGLLVALQVLKFLDKKNLKPSYIRELLELYPSVLINVRVREKIPFSEILGLEELVDFTKKELGDTGRLIIRYSGTENVCRIMIEGKDEERITRLAERLEKLIKESLGL